MTWTGRNCTHITLHKMLWIVFEFELVQVVRKKVFFSLKFYNVTVCWMFCQLSIDHIQATLTHWSYFWSHWINIATFIKKDSCATGVRGGRCPRALELWLWPTQVRILVSASFLFWVVLYSLWSENGNEIKTISYGFWDKIYSKSTTYVCM